MDQFVDNDREPSKLDPGLSLFGSLSLSAKVRNPMGRVIALRLHSHMPRPQGCNQSYLSSE